MEETQRERDLIYSLHKRKTEIRTSVIFSILITISLQPVRLEVPFDLIVSHSEVLSIQLRTIIQT